MARPYIPKMSPESRVRRMLEKIAARLKCCIVIEFRYRDGTYHCATLDYRYTDE